MGEILVLIASYKDADLINTINNAVEMAKYPDRIHFAICYQDDVAESYYQAIKDTSNLKIIVVPPNESKGCCWSRSLSQELYGGEDYVLQIDSHMRFVKDWDDRMINTLNECSSDKPILTSYCNDTEDYDEYLKGLQDDKEQMDIGHTLASYCMNVFRFPLFSFGSYIDNFDKPYRGAFISGHFIFGKSDWIKEVPYDPALCFWGEEITLAVRLWTNGWDIFHPAKVLCYHRYGRNEDTVIDDSEKRVVHWQEHNDTLFDYLSKDRVRRLLCQNEDLGEYGLGSVRTLEDYEAFSGVYFSQKLLTNKALAGYYEADNSLTVHSYNLGKVSDWNEEFAETKTERDEVI